MVVERKRQVELYEFMLVFVKGERASTACMNQLVVVEEERVCPHVLTGRHI